MIYHPNSNKQFFLQINGSFEYSFDIMTYHFKDSYNWISDITIPIYQIELMIFLNCCFINNKTNYNSLKLEMVCLI